MLQISAWIQLILFILQTPDWFRASGVIRVLVFKPNASDVDASRLDESEIALV